MKQGSGSGSGVVEVRFTAVKYQIRKGKMLILQLERIAIYVIIRMSICGSSPREHFQHQYGEGSVHWEILGKNEYYSILKSPQASTLLSVFMFLHRSIHSKQSFLQTQECQEMGRNRTACRSKLYHQHQPLETLPNSPVYRSSSRIPFSPNCSVLGAFLDVISSPSPSIQSKCNSSKQCFHCKQITFLSISPQY